MHNRTFCLNCGNRNIMVDLKRDHIKCNDGTTLSVQVGSSLYCTPRNDVGPWTHVEVGFPSVPPPETWAEYGDGYSDEGPLGVHSDVFAYVPVALVEEYIASHGGRAIWV